MRLLKKKNFLFKEVSKLCISVILLLVTLIILKAFPNLKENFYSSVFEKNISFASINSIYEKYAGSPLPFQNLFNDPTTPVFNESLKYTEAHKYLDGVKLVVDENYLLPSLDSGLVVFIGEKENYGNTIIVQQINGVDVWYGNVNTSDVKLYDYVEKGSLLSETNGNYMYLAFQKEGKFLDYKKYI